MGCREEDASARVRVWRRRRRGGGEGEKDVVRVEKTGGRVAISFGALYSELRWAVQKGGHRVRDRKSVV